MTTPPATIPYGAWPSPLSAAEVAAGTSRPSWPRLVARATGTEVWWSESRPAEAGRTTVVRRDTDGTAALVLPAPWNARTRVHEYGGNPWVVDRGALVFAEFTDQRLYRLEPGGTPTPLTAEPAEPAASRYAELTVVGDEIWCVGERHDGGTVGRSLVAVPLDGSGRVRELVTGSRFLAAPTLSPDGRTLAWIGWDHPQMPWDGTELWVAPVEDGTVGRPRVVIGGPAESVLQPQWQADGRLLALTDRSGWWNLVGIDPDGADPDAAVTPLHPTEQEFGGPLWALGSTWYAALQDGQVVAAHGDGLGVLTAEGAWTDLDLPFTGYSMLRTDGQQVALVATSPGAPPAVVLVAADGSYDVIDAGAPPPVGPEWISVPQRRAFPSSGGRVVHALVSPPTSPTAIAPAGTRPPYVVFVHGGPTSSAATGLDLEKLSFTSRGIGVIDVDYGGSTGYGRAYRNALRGQWGVLDVEDCVAAVRGLVDAGEADGARLLIRGGSAGGWTVLAALTRADVFAAGASYFGVADALALARDTHDFESRYLDAMIGPLPEAQAVYEERSPLSHVDGLSCPVLLLQGAEDAVVPPAQAEMFRDALVRKQIPHAYLLFEGEQHGFRRAENVAAALEAELSFYGQVLGFETPGVPTLALTTGS